MLYRITVERLIMYCKYSAYSTGTYARLFFGSVTVLLWCIPVLVHAEATFTPDTVVIEKAQVIAILSESSTTVPGTGVLSREQVLKAQILEGPDFGHVITFKNDYIPLASDDVFYARHQVSVTDGTDFWSVSDPYRLNILAVLLVVFLLLVFMFGGIQGIRGLLSLIGSLLLILFVLLPGILHGYSPIFVSLTISSFIIVLGSYITHGFNRTTSAAVIGMIITVCVTGIGAYYAVHLGHFSGFTSEENIDLNFNTQGGLNMVGLLFSGIMIGLLGVLYDMAIGQAIAVEELCAAGSHMTRIHVYARAIRIGREHIGALINTLAIAYVGAALPLLLLFKQTYTPNIGLLTVLNGEIFATEIVRILIGSIGVILAVPVTTIVATYLLHGRTFHNVQRSHVHGHHH